jgi:hypothetical protein
MGDVNGSARGDLEVHADRDADVEESDAGGGSNRVRPFVSQLSILVTKFRDTSPARPRGM